MTPDRPPFFVVGAPRSGTTLVQQLLSRHPHIAVAPETHFVARFVGPGTGRAARWQRPWRQLIDAVVATPEFGDSGVDEAFFRAACDARPGRHSRDVFGRWLECFGDQHGAELVGEKTPNHLFAADLLRTWFPGCRFVVVLRDPRAVVVSTREVWWTAGSARGDARAWRRYETALRRLQADVRAETDTVLVRYEDLVVDPQSQADRVFALLGLTPVDIAAGSAAPATGLDTVREPWKAGAHGPVTMSSRQRWQDLMSAADVRAVESVCRHGMRRRGYPVRTPTRHLAAGVVVEDALAWARTAQLVVTRRDR